MSIPSWNEVFWYNIRKIEISHLFGMRRRNLVVHVYHIPKCISLFCQSVLFKIICDKINYFCINHFAPRLLENLFIKQKYYSTETCFLILWSYLVTHIRDKKWRQNTNLTLKIQNGCLKATKWVKRLRSFKDSSTQG